MWLTPPPLACSRRAFSVFLDYVYGGEATFELLSAFPHYPQVAYPDPEAREQSQLIRALLSPSSPSSSTPRDNRCDVAPVARNPMSPPLTLAAMSLHQSAAELIRSLDLEALQVDDREESRCEYCSTGQGSGCQDGTLVKLPAVAVAAELLALDTVKYFGLSSNQHLPSLSRHFLEQAVEQQTDQPNETASTTTRSARPVSARVRAVCDKHVSLMSGVAEFIRCTLPNPHRQTLSRWKA